MSVNKTFLLSLTFTNCFVDLNVRNQPVFVAVLCRFGKLQLPPQ